MSRNHLRRVAPSLPVVLALVVFVAAPGAIQAQRTGLSNSVVYHSGVDFQPNVQYEGAVLTVSGGDTTYQLQFEADEPISIGMFDSSGQPLSDGSYSWQLDLVPPADIARELRIGASKNGGRAPDGWASITGSFTIREGSIVDSDSAESRGSFDEGLRVGTSSSFVPSSFAASRPAAVDDDEAVGTRASAEAEVNAAASRSSAAPGTAVLQVDRSGFEDSDAVSTAMSRSLERGASDNNQLSAQSRGIVPQPRSDGSNGRPRS